MYFALERVSDPTIEPVTLAQMKLHLNEFDSVTSNDAAITNLIIAGREWVEDYTGRALIDQSWRLTIGRYEALYANVDSDTVTGYYRGPEATTNDGSILLLKSPALSIVSFDSVNADGTLTAIDPATYELREANSKDPRVTPLSGAQWLTAQKRIVFRAGFANLDTSPAGDADDVPERFKQAIKLWVEANYDRDKDMMDRLLDVAERLIKSERRNLQVS